MVAGGKVVSNGTVVVGFARYDCRIVDDKTFASVQFIGFGCKDGTFAFCVGVGPEVFDVAFYVQWTGCDTGKEHMLIHRKHFLSVEEIALACPKVSKTHMQMLKEAGAFGDLPDTSQISLF